MSDLPKAEQWGKSRVYLGGWPNRDSYRGGSWDTEKYRSAVRVQLNSIHSTMAGSILLNSMQKRVVIVPVDEKTQATNTGDMLGSATSIDSIDRIKYPKAPRFPSVAADGPAVMPANAAEKHGNPEALWNDAAGLNGKGSEYLIQFTPAFYYKSSALYQNFGHGFTADAILFHELVHASRGTRGVFDQKRTTGKLALGDSMERYSNHDEFVAILLTNIFRSERYPGAKIRRSHNPKFEEYHQPGNFKSSCQFLAAMDRFFLQSPSVSRGFARQVRAKFNPIREYYGKPGLQCS